MPKTIKRTIIIVSPTGEELHRFTTIKSDARQCATKINMIREDEYLAILNGTKEDTYGIRKEMLRLLPSVVQVKQEGGLSKHYDYTLVLQDGTSRTVELKTSQSSWTRDEWRPWTPGVQFLQGQVKSKLAQSFMGSCGMPILHAFFTDVVIPFLSTHEQCTPCKGMTLEGYLQGATGLKPTDVRNDTKARTFFQLLRANPDLAEQLRKQWIQHEESYLGTHTFDHTAFTKVVKEILESKDWWLCCTKSGNEWIEGFRVLDVSYTGVAKKRDGGHLFQYSLTLQKKSGGESRVIPITCRLYWKNGGQAVQNLNFQIK